MAQTTIFSGSHRAPITSSIGTFTLVVERVFAWRERLRSRRDLMRLSEHQLKDIGLSRNDAETEWQKPFWQS